MTTWTYWSSPMGLKTPGASGPWSSSANWSAETFSRTSARYFALNAIDVPSPSTAASTWPTWSPISALALTVIPGSPIPFAGNTPAERLAVGRALIDEMRTEFGIAAQRHTVAVGWTDIDELASQRFRGASRSIRATAPLPAPTPHIVAPRAGTHFLDHAEQDIVNGFIDAVEGVGLGGSTLEGKTLRVHISHPRGPCAACAQGVTGADVDPGILLQLSQRYPGLTVSLSWETPAGQLQGMLLQNGMRL